MEFLHRACLSPSFWSGKRVFLTGHTGFKGGWMTKMVVKLGAEVRGFSLAPITNPSIFDVLDIASSSVSQIADINDPGALDEAIHDYQPHIVIHMAAQPLVSVGYDDPALTFETNVMGTVKLLEACRKLPSETLLLVVSTDKCYENAEEDHPLREGEPLGGKDPYSASKAGTELVVGSYRSSFFASDGAPRLASARAGNVVGGGDWSENRLIPDAMRAFAEGCPLMVRNPLAVRPWQHVLEPIYGYLLLIQSMADDAGLARGWNFGPIPSELVSVKNVADQAVRIWGEGTSWTSVLKPQEWSEAGSLSLDASAAYRAFGWAPALDINETIGWTVSWYKMFHQSPDQIAQFTDEQLGRYLALQSGAVSSQAS